MNDSVTDFNSSERISESPQQLCLFFCLCYIQINLVQCSLQNLSSLDRNTVIS